VVGLLLKQTLFIIISSATSSDEERIFSQGELVGG
jgi:hypothetical protein